MFKQNGFRKAISRASFRNGVSITLLLILISGVVIGARAWSAPGSNAGVPVLSGVVQSGSTIETVSVVLKPNGFTPAAVTRAAGPFRLEVANQSGMQDFTLQIRHDRGQGVVQEWRVEGGTQSWSGMVNLEPGGYVLTVAENRACLFHIAVQ